jgi:hypothetical protein
VAIYDKMVQAALAQTVVVVVVEVLLGQQILQAEVQAKHSQAIQIKFHRR